MDKIVIGLNHKKSKLREDDEENRTELVMNK
jgi:hypothetical protein